MTTTTTTNDLDSIQKLAKDYLDIGFIYYFDANKRQQQPDAKRNGFTQKIYNLFRETETSAKLTVGQLEDILAYLMAVYADFNFNSNQIYQTYVFHDQWTAITDHFRLYCDCLLYQLKQISRIRKLEQILGCSHDSQQYDLCLGHLLYIPAYSIIDHHRIACKLTRNEDECIRRCAILAIILKLNEQKWKPLVLGMINICKNEYLHLSDANSTSINQDPCRAVILNLEYNFIDLFVRKFLAKRLGSWINNLDQLNIVIFNNKKDNDNGRKKLADNRFFALNSLRLIKIIVRHFKLKPSRMSDYVLSLRQSIRLTLQQLISSHFALRLDQLIIAQQQTHSPKQTKPKMERQKNDDFVGNSWRLLLNDVRMLDNDLKLYWSRKGLSELLVWLKDKPKQSSTISMADDQANKLISLIEKKLGLYLYGTTVEAASSAAATTLTTKTKN